MLLEVKQTQHLRYIKRIVHHVVQMLSQKITFFYIKTPAIENRISQKGSFHRQGPAICYYDVHRVLISLAERGFFSSYSNRIAPIFAHERR